MFDSKHKQMLIYNPFKHESPYSLMLDNMGLVNSAHMFHYYIISGVAGVGCCSSPLPALPLSMNQQHCWSHHHLQHLSFPACWHFSALDWTLNLEILHHLHVSSASSPRPGSWHPHSFLCSPGQTSTSKGSPAPCHCHKSRYYLHIMVSLESAEYHWRGLSSDDPTSTFNSTLYFTTPPDFLIQDRSSGLGTHHMIPHDLQNPLQLPLTFTVLLCQQPV